MADTLNVTDRFDGAAHWAALSEESKAAIGAATLEQLASEYMADRAYDDDRPVWDRVAGAAEQACRAIVKDVFVEAIPHEAMEAPDGAPRIPSLLGMVCRACGCSQDDACPEGCGWAEADLCTACAPAGAVTTDAAAPGTGAAPCP